MTADISKFKEGQVVRSKAGRDQGEWMVVLEILDDNYVAVCNGTSRKVSNPKKKKIKHLARTNHVSPLFRNKKKKNMKITNHDIRNILKPYKIKTDYED